MNQEYFKQAELALAAYADFVTNIPTQDELTDIGFSDVQVLDSFIPVYPVVDQI
mgnify:CR=1 FL=1